MSTPVLMPKLGESVVEGTVARWLKTVGETVVKLEPLLEISTDKIDTEVPAPANGTLIEIVVTEGNTVQVGAVLARIGEETTPDAQAQSRRQQQEARVGRVDERLARNPGAPGGRQEQGPVVGREYLSPVVKRMAADHAIDLNQVQGSGQAGRVTKQDLLAYLGRTEEVEEPVGTAQTASSNPPPAAKVAVEGDEILHPLNAMRRTIAQHMVLSVQTSPHVTTVFEVDMAAVARHRERNRAESAQRGVRLTFVPYVVAAAAAALRKHPLANSRFTEDGILEQRRIHIGVAVAVPNGLLVPVVRDADELTLLGIARAIIDLAERARSNSLSPDDLHGGTFTVTNHGAGGSLIGTPIIYQPQSAILGMGAIVKRPVVISLDESVDSLLSGPGDAIVVRPMCYLSLSFDHRVLDGASADAFMSAVKRRLERWNE